MDFYDDEGNVIWFQPEYATGRWFVHDLKAMKMYPASSKGTAEIWAEALNRIARREGYDATQVKSRRDAIRP